MLCAFIFERVSRLSPQEKVQGHVSSFVALCRYATFLPRWGAWKVQEAFDDKFFIWWFCQIHVVDDYPYVGINLLRNHDMSMDPSEEDGNIGTHYFIF